MKTYFSTRRMLHDGKPLSAGETLELGDKAARPLLALGAIATEEGLRARAEVAMVAAGIPVDGAGAADDGSDGAVKMTAEFAGGDGAGVSDALIEQAIRAFTPDDFTKAGEPRISTLMDAVQKLASTDDEKARVYIEAEDRDRVWNAMVSAGFKIPEGASS